jgi:hypothetical protein
MIVLHKGCNGHKTKEKHIVVIFGVGLIGTNLMQELFRHSYIIATTLPYSWGEVNNRTNENSAIIRCIEPLIKHGCSFPKSDFSYRIDFVWAAGKGGFRMQEGEILSELSSFLDVISLAITFSKSNPMWSVRFHMLSSAGGLFEGQRNVGADSVPCAKRPYGSLKLQQERLLSSCTNMVQFVYRPSSVFGFAGLNRRLGLIPTLLWNGLNNKVSSIFGSSDTLRDYVWAKDIGRFISNVILSKTSVAKYFILASGKPTSLFEILRRIERILNKKIYYNYINDGSGNIEHTTFNPNIYPEGWRSQDLNTGIRSVLNSIL